MIVRNGGGMWAGPSNGRASDVIALTADSKDWGDGVKLAYVREARHAACQFAGTKILSWAMNLTWLESAQARGFDEVILLNERGEVAECTSANLFVANGNQVWTPPLEFGLPARHHARSASSARSTPPASAWQRRRCCPADLESADEVFITSTTRDLLPVIQIEDKKIGRSDHTRQALARAFSEFLQNYVATHKQVVA